MPRFVVLEHTSREGVHFDLMLEHVQGTLWTWSFSQFPGAGTSCRRLFDHRPLYLDLEGDVGEGKGTVKRVDAGTLDWLNEEEGRVYVTLRGTRIQGSFLLTRNDDATWTFSVG